ncbi:polymorphic toxin-type HINT domain-containing protein [Amycolatopsis regifaucium]|uniref:polymorphic toxin-type HINT domain-containing protein n=1 Tax=Amycolatopsis regifaucium TaxID=546365 RepID=UPI0020109B27|nr:polymorphic toxin-type HINT domain-containing protein [Amycolatopsis regifaucium]
MNPKHAASTDLGVDRSAFEFPFDAAVRSMPRTGGLMETAGRPLTRSILYGLSGGALSVLFILAAAQQAEAAPAVGGKGGSGQPVDLHKVRELAKGSEKRQAAEQAQRKTEERKTEKPQEKPAPRQGAPVGGKGGSGQPVDLRKIMKTDKNSNQRKETQQTQRKTEEHKTEKPQEKPAPRQGAPVGGKGGSGQPVDLRKIMKTDKDRHQDTEQPQRKTGQPTAEKPQEKPAPRQSIPVGGKGGSGQPVDLRKIMKIDKGKDSKDHLVGNVLDEARETVVEGLASIPHAIKGFVDANQDATTWSEADPNSDEWRAADKRIKERGEAVAEVVRNPGKVVEEVVRPYKEDWNSDQPERVVGRAAVDIGTMFIPGVGVGKRVMNAAEALSGGRGPDLGTIARPRPDREPGKGSTSGSPTPADLPARPDSGAGTPNPQNSPDRAGTAPPTGTQGSKADTTAPRTSSRSPNKDGQDRRVLPAPVTQLPTLPRGDSPARRAADKPRQDTDTPPSPKSGDAESKQRSSDRTPEADTKTSPESRDSADAATRCPTPNSFVPGTPVLLADGTYKPIEKVNLGDRVLATDPVTGLTQARPVINLIPGQGLKELVRITVDTDGDRGNATGTVTATDEHPFWVADTGRWTDAEDLNRGDLLRTPDGRLLQVVAVHEWTQQQQVHNLTIEGLHTYYVNVGGQDILTHNAGEENCFAGTPGSSERSMTREQWRAEQSRQRAERSVANVDRPLENPLPNAGQEGHGHGRHGYQTTDGQQATRVRTGIAPDGSSAPAGRASRFRNAQAEAEALGRAASKLEANLRDGAVPSYTDPVTGKPLYFDPASGVPVRHRVLVTTDDPRGFGESAQVARRVGGPSSPFVLDANGNRIPDLVVTPQKTARVVYEYVRSANEWRPISYYPEP